MAAWFACQFTKLTFTYSQSKLFAKIKKAPCRRFFYSKVVVSGLSDCDFNASRTDADNIYTGLTSNRLSVLQACAGRLRCR